MKLTADASDVFTSFPPLPKGWVRTGSTFYWNNPRPSPGGAWDYMSQAYGMYLKFCDNPRSKDFGKLAEGSISCGDRNFYLYPATFHEHLLLLSQIGVALQREKRRSLYEEEVSKTQDFRVQLIDDLIEQVEYLRTEYFPQLP